jgi:hypothetical protein
VQVFLRKFTVTQLVQKSLCFSGTQGFIAVFTKICHWALYHELVSQFNLVHTLYLISLRPILIYSPVYTCGTRSTKWSLSMKFSHHNFVLLQFPQFCITAISHLPHVADMLLQTLQCLFLGIKHDLSLPNEWIIPNYSVSSFWHLMWDGTNTNTNFTG